MDAKAKDDSVLFQFDGIDESSVCSHFIGANLDKDASERSIQIFFLFFLIMSLI